MSDSSGTIDITEVVALLKSTWVKLSTDAILAWVISIPGLQWLGLPIIRNLFRFGVEKITQFIGDTAEMAAFFENTAIRKYAQAGDFVKAVNDLNNLPPTASQDEYEKYELQKIAAFRVFVSVTM